MATASPADALAREVARLSPGRPNAFPRWCDTFLDWHPHEKQEAFGASQARLLLLICGIRFGKSDVAAARFLHHMFFTPEGKFLNASFSQDQADIVVEKAHALAMEGPLRGFVKKYVLAPHPALTLKNGAILTARSTKDANLLRGRAYHGINLDEGAFARRDDAELLQGRVMDYAGWVSVTSTPKGKNWLFEWWVLAQMAQMRGDPAYLALTGTTYDNPVIPRAEIERNKATWIERRFRQEIMGEFVDLEGATFPADVLERVFQDYVPESEPIRYTAGPHQGKLAGIYPIGWDLGRKTTLSVGTVLEASTPVLRGVNQVRMHSAPWPKIFEAIETEERRWNGSTILDSTGVGDVVLQSVNIGATPFIFTARSRTDLITELQTVCHGGRIVLPSAWTDLRTQMLLHTWAEDAEDQTWDDFDSLALAVHHAGEITFRGPALVRLDTAP